MSISAARWSGWLVAGGLVISATAGSARPVQAQEKTVEGQGQQENERAATEARAQAESARKDAIRARAESVRAQVESRIQGQAVRIQGEAARAQGEAARVYGQAMRENFPINFTWTAGRTTAAGLELAEVSDALRSQVEIPEKQGVVIVRVLKGGPGDKAGFEDNDILLKIDDATISNVNDAAKQLDQPRDKKVEVRVIRKGKPVQSEYAGPPSPRRTALTLRATASNRVEEYWIGVPVSPVDPTLRSHLGDLVKPGVGLIVNDIAADSPAKKAGLEKNDILVAIESAPLTSQDVLLSRVRGSDGKPLAFEVIRGGKTKTVTITPEKHAEGMTFRTGQGGITMRRVNPNGPADVLEADRIIINGQAMPAMPPIPPVPPQMIEIKMLEQLQGLSGRNESEFKRLETELKELDGKLDEIRKLLKDLPKKDQ